MKRLALLLISSLFTLGAFAAPGQTSSTSTTSTTPQNGQGGSGAPGQEVHGACKADIAKLCPGIEPGGGRIGACMKQHQDEISQGCKTALEKRYGQKAGGANAATPAKN